MMSTEPGVPLTGTDRKPTDAELDVYGLTHQGKVRLSNQDHFIMCALRKQVDVLHSSLPAAADLAARERIAFLAMVADGVSGELGEEASRHAVQSITRYVTQSMHCYYATDDTGDDAFHAALQDAAMHVHASLVSQTEATPHGEHRATTLTLWLTVWPRAYLLQVGDSRFYVLRGDTLVQISRDQNFAQDLVDAGVLSRSEAQNTRWPHVLSSAIGGPHATPVVTRIDQPWHNVNLLCTDGLTKHVSEDQIRDRLINMTSAKQVCEALVQDALEGGGTDNITVVVGRAIRQ